MGVGIFGTSQQCKPTQKNTLKGSESRPEILERASAVLVSASLENGTAITGLTVGVDGKVNTSATTPRIRDGAVYSITYTAPNQSRLHAQSFRTERSWVDRGEIKTGDLECSIPVHLQDLTTPNPAWLASEHDLFLFPDLRMRRQQLLQRGRIERLIYSEIHEILQVYQVDANTGTVQTYSSSDYTVSSNGTLTWGANAPSGWYTVDYIAAPHYYVFQELPQVRHIDGQFLPRRVGLRLFDLYPGRKT